MKIAIIVDSSASLSVEEINKLGWNFLPLYINIDGKEYADGVDFTSENIFEFYKKSSKAHTSASNLQEAKNLFDKLSKTHDKVIMYPISTELSSQYANLSVLAQEYDNIDVIQSKNICELIVLDLFNFLDKKIQSLSEYEEALKDLGTYKKDQQVLLVPKYPDSLVKGGRLSPTAAAIAKLLKIVPIIEFKNGALVKYGKGRVFNKVVSGIVKDTIKLTQKKPNLKNLILHSECSDLQNFVNMYDQNELKYIYNIPSVVTIHTGLEAIVILALNTTDAHIEKLKKLRNQ